MAFQDLICTHAYKTLLFLTKKMWFHTDQAKLIFLGTTKFDFKERLAKTVQVHFLRVFVGAFREKASAQFRSETKWGPLDIY